MIQELTEHRIPISAEERPHWAHEVVSTLNQRQLHCFIVAKRRVIAAPMPHSYRLGLVTWMYQVRIPDGPDICHRSCAYTVLQTFQMPGVYSAAYITVHYKEPLESFEIRVRHSPGLGLPPVVILS